MELPFLMEVLADLKRKGFAIDEPPVTSQATMKETPAAYTLGEKIKENPLLDLVLGGTASNLQQVAMGGSPSLLDAALEAPTPAKVTAPLMAGVVVPAAGSLIHKLKGMDVQRMWENFKVFKDPFTGRWWQQKENPWLGREKSTEIAEGRQPVQITSADFRDMPPSLVEYVDKGDNYIFADHGNTNVKGSFYPDDRSIGVKGKNPNTYDLTYPHELQHRISNLVGEEPGTNVEAASRRLGLLNKQQRNVLEDAADIGDVSPEWLFYKHNIGEMLADSAGHQNIDADIPPYGLGYFSAMLREIPLHSSRTEEVINPLDIYNEYLDYAANEASDVLNTMKDTNPEWYKYLMRDMGN